MVRSITLISLFFVFICSIHIHCSAAFPIQEQHKAAPIVQKTSLPNRYYNKHSEDNGVFGILAIIFGLTGLFPFAIACGIFGTQNGRKFKGLAKAGLILGILAAVIFTFWLFYLFVII